MSYFTCNAVIKYPEEAMSGMTVILGIEGIASEAAVSCGSGSLGQLVTLPLQSGSKET
jgi:hypothetical protein